MTVEVLLYYHVSQRASSCACERERERGRVRKVSVETFYVKHDDFLFYLASKKIQIMHDYSNMRFMYEIITLTSTLTSLFFFSCVSLFSVVPNWPGSRRACEAAKRKKK